MNTDLGDKMRALAATGHARAEELIRLADAFEAAAVAYPFDTKKLVGCWARARRCWCECSGEALVTVD